MLLPSLITLRRPASAELQPEDIFGDTLGCIFTDDLQNQHGDDADTVILYKNSRHGQLEFRTADINGEEQRRKFAHYLWNAGVLMGELIGGRPAKSARDSGSFENEDRDEEEGFKDGEWWVTDDEEKHWNMEGETVLELGAGVGLGGIVSALSGAKEVTITDYPAESILDTIRANVAKNVPEDTRSVVSIQGHLWGTQDAPFESEHAQRYTRILAADCLWMPWEHENLAKSMLHFLADVPHARVYCIAGFHTGRAKMAPFFDQVIPQQGLEVEDIFEMDANGERRPWATERDGGTENIGERKKWLVLARIRRAAQ
ncbi:hypothetical protein ACN47E_001784 [Coniothyrium glycines]